MSKKASKSKGVPSGSSKGLYPTIAISDAFNALMHLLAAYFAFQGSNYVGMIGYFTVALAATVGVLRFGFNEDRYALANSNLADMAAFVGLPCVGYSFSMTLPFIKELPIHSLVLAVSLMMVEALSRSFPPLYRHLMKVFVTLFFFVAPVTISSILRRRWWTFGAILLFVIAGLVVKPLRHEYLLGIRRENIFHYLIGVASYVIALDE